MVIGCLLGAAIITSSLLVGDSLRASVRDAARTELGPVDEIVSVPATRLGAAAAALRAPVPGVSGTLPVLRAPAVALSGGGTRRAEPDSQVLELDFAAARRLGGDVALTGLAGAGATPAPGEAVVGEEAARALRIGPGDRIVVLASGGPRGVARSRGGAQAGHRRPGGDRPGEVANILVAPGTLGRTARRPAPARRGPPRGSCSSPTEAGYSGASGAPTPLPASSAGVSPASDGLGAAGQARPARGRPTRPAAHSPRSSRPSVRSR